MGAKPNLFIPALNRFYSFAIPVSWLIIRLAVGCQLFVAGWGKIGRTRAPNELLKKIPDLDPSIGHGITLSLLGVELIGGFCIAIGLFTRFWAAAAAIEMAVLTFYIYWPNGYAWRQDGYQFVLMWGLVLFAIALRGGSHYSIDRRIGSEL